MPTVRQSFSAVTNAITMVNEQWPAVILIAVLVSHLKALKSSKRWDASYICAGTLIIGNKVFLLWKNASWRNLK